MRSLIALAALAFLSACALHDETGARLVRADSCKTADVVHAYGIGPGGMGKWCYNRVADGGTLSK